MWEIENFSLFHQNGKKEEKWEGNRRNRYRNRVIEEI